MCICYIETNKLAYLYLSPPVCLILQVNIAKVMRILSRMHQLQSAETLQPL